MPLRGPYRLVLGALLAWTLLLAVTHLGARSPYTQDGRIANADAPTVVSVTRFFFDGTTPDYPTAHNLKLPLHSYVVATAMAFVRSYLAANYAVNVLALALLVFCAARVGAGFAIRPAALLIALGTVLTLPPFVAYVGQPMHYTVGLVANFLLVLAVIAMPPGELCNPWLAGAIAASFAVGYDPYVFLLGFLLLLALTRFGRRRDDAIFLAVAIVPPVLWHLFLGAMSRGNVSDDIRQRFVYAVVVEWAAFFEAPIQRILLPFVASHIGMHVAVQQVIASIHWPLLVCAGVALWIARPPLLASQAGRIGLLLVVAFVLEQLATAAFDWENSPRRAMPVGMAFAVAYVWVVDRFHAQRVWRFLFVALFVFSALLAFSDVLSGKNGLSYLYSGEAIRRAPKEALLVVESELKPAAAPAATETMLAHGRWRARLTNVPLFLFAQAFGAAMVLTLSWILARARIAPRWAPIAAGLLVLASAIRFVF